MGSILIPGSNLTVSAGRMWAFTLCGMRIAARHADADTTMRYDRARHNLDRHPNCILAASMAFGTTRPAEAHAPADLWAPKAAPGR